MYTLCNAIGEWTPAVKTKICDTDFYKQLTLLGEQWLASKTPPCMPHCLPEREVRPAW
jgi:hypothetical protein